MLCCSKKSKPDPNPKAVTSPRAQDYMFAPSEMDQKIKAFKLATADATPRRFVCEQMGYPLERYQY